MAAGDTIGFIGLGLMGKPMARNLKAAGRDLLIHNRSRAVVDELAAEGMSAAASPAAVAETADIIVLMLPDTSAVETVLFGENGIADAIRPGTLVIDMGTTAVSATRAFANAIRERNGDYVDAPVSGGQVGAEAGALTIMAGGDESTFDRALPLFEIMGRHVTRVGEVGAGQVAKAANQVIVGLTIGAVAEALALAKAAGVDPAQVRAALAGGFADSRILELHGARMITGDFTPGGRAVTQRKDMAQTLAFAAELELDLPATALNRDLYDRLIAAGDGDLDHSALFKVVEKKN